LIVFILTPVTESEFNNVALRDAGASCSVQSSNDGSGCTDAIGGDIGSQ